MDRELRKNQNTIVICGTGVILFALWSVLKTALSAIFNSLDSVQNLDLSFKSEEGIITVVFLLMIILILLVDIYIRIKIGRAAINYGKGNSHSTTFVFWAYMMLIFTIINFGLFVAGFFFSEDMLGNNWNDIVTLIFIELTNISNIMELIHSTKKIKKYLKFEE